MIILIAGAILSVVMLIFSWKISLCVLGVTLVLLFIPLEGYKPRNCERIELLQLEGPEIQEGTYYVISKKRQVTYAFDNADEYNIDGVAYHEVNIRGKIRIYESKECKEAILKVFIQEPNRSEGFALALFGTRKEYVFYVPKGTVIHKDK